MITVKCTQSLLRNNPLGIKVLFDEIKNIVSSSGLIVYPTDTLYALGASPDDKLAIARLYKIKHRPVSMSLSVAVCNISEIEKYAITTPNSKKLADRFLPGPLTLILKNRGRFKAIKGKTIGVRISAHPVTLKLIESCGPLTATSANVHNMDEPVDVQTSMNQLKKNINVYIDSGRCKIAKGSTILDMAGKKPILLREGAITSKQIEECLHDA